MMLLGGMYCICIDRNEVCLDDDIYSFIILHQQVKVVHIKIFDKCPCMKA